MKENGTLTNTVNIYQTWYMHERICIYGGLVSCKKLISKPLLVSHTWLYSDNIWRQVCLHNWCHWRLLCPYTHFIHADSMTHCQQTSIFFKTKVNGFVLSAICMAHFTIIYWSDCGLWFCWWIDIAIFSFLWIWLIKLFPTQNAIRFSCDVGKIWSEIVCYDF